ncbi:PAS domain S-box protein [Flavobacterium yafengii]|uniref:PAS domain S-box protein n=1 Tax=Flavobacterium yafengii TaxID=3041253 RepID=UPI0024A95664|nr:PAS domain S-box protein [Flavobacterium yafengii]MDI5896895.1 PAS domain S-box protein [Flavobacterium yafengii]
MPLLQNIKKIRKLFDNIDFQQEFNNILLFVSEICEVPYAFISFNDTVGLTVKAKIGVNFITVPHDIVEFNETIIRENKISIISGINKSICNPSDNLNSLGTHLDFFVGLPICINKNLVVGTFCIMDSKPRKLSPIQLKTLNHAVLQIQSLLKLHIQKEELQNKMKEKEIQFQSFIDNSKEILYELNQDGIITFVSKNWKFYLGHQPNEVIGKKNILMLHPDDVEMCIAFFKTIDLGAIKNEMTYRVLHKDGHYVWHATSIKLSIKGGEKKYMGNCRDITKYIEAQQKIVAQKEFYEKILDRLPTDVAVFDSNYRYTYLNPAAIKNDELRKFIIGKTDFEYAEHTGRDDSFAKSRCLKFLQALESRSTIEWEDTIDRLDGQKTDYIRKLTPVFRDDGALEMMVGFGVDITESKRIQEEILKSRQLIQSIIQHVAVGILVQGPNSEILENNKAACEMLGLTEDQLLGKTSFDDTWKVIHLDGTDFTSEEHPVPQAIQKLKPINNIIMGVYRPISNDLVWLLVDAIPVFGDYGELLYVICSFNDITAQKNAEDALKISNERFVYSIKATSDAIWDWNMITDEMFVGGSYSILFGHHFKNNIIKRQKYENFIYPEDKVAYFKSIDKFINGDLNRWSEEYRYLKSDGTYAFVNDKAVIIRNNDGKAIRMIGAMRDISQKKNLIDQLKQSEEKFKGAFENSAVGMALVNNKGYFIEVNDRLCEILGYSSQEMKSLRFQEITHYEDLKIDLEYKEKIATGKISNFSSEKRFIHKNKSIVWAHRSFSIAKNNTTGINYIVQIIDITERKKIEDENKLLIEENNRNKTIQLNEARNMYRLLADNTIDLVCLHNLDTSFQYVSPSIQKLLDYAPEELLGKSPLDLAHPEDLKYLQESFNDFISKKVDGSTIARFKARNGNYIWLETKATLTEKEGEITGFQSSSRDITIRKKEEEAIEKALLKERELNELRINLISTISHEFRTPMTTIRTSAELIALYIDDQNSAKSSLLQKRVNTITEEIDRIVDLMNAVLIISKEDSGKTNFNPVKFDLKQLCINVIENSYSNLNNNLKIQTYFEKDSFTVFADTKLMEYSIFNILNNAFKYSKGCEDIIFNLFTADDTVVIEIIDFGIGIPEEDQSKLYNTFFRASNTTGIQGTGLGLYIVKTFTTKNSGNVQLESQLGKGTKVTLQFPLHKL